MKPSVAETMLVRYGSPADKAKYKVGDASVSQKERRALLKKDLLDDVSFGTKITYFNFVDKLRTMQREENLVTTGGNSQ